MNFLAEVLSCAQTMELKEVNEKIPVLQLKIEEIKDEIVHYMEAVFLNFNERPRQRKKLFNEVKSMETEISVLMQNLEILTKKNLPKAKSDLDQNSMKLSIISFTLRSVSQLCFLNEQLIALDNMLKDKDYLSCMKLLNECELFLGENLENEHLMILQEVQMEFLTKKNNLLNEISKVFSNNVLIKSKDENCTILKINKNLSDVQKALKALYLKDSVISLLSSFAGSIWNYFITSTVDNEVTLLETEDEDFNILEITVNTIKKKSLYSEVLNNLKTIFQFIKSHFDLELTDSISTMQLLGEDIKDNLSEIIIKHCLEDTIPSTSEELQSYRTVKQEIENFETALKSYHIFTKDTTPLMEYANNIDIHFINKICKEYILSCDVIMKKDLHDMKEVGIPYNPEKILDLPENEMLHCCVSKSAIQLMNFLEKVMVQVVSASEVCAATLLYTVKTVILKYGHVVPEYHSKMLQTIPQQVALFYNNCFFISKELSRWKGVYCTRLSPKVDSDHCSFIEEAHQIQQIGADCFTNYVRKTMESLSVSGLEGPMLEEISADTEKSVRQCLRQQELLKTVWHKVLSYPLYNKTIGKFLDCMCSNIINSIVSIEDISSKAAEMLVEVFKIVINRGPKLFTDPKEINLFVPSWYKFNELNFVLAASLVDISDRWADGKGPLALQFKASEIKSLIRALFQNTDRRAAVLARIQD